MKKYFSKYKCPNCQRDLEKFEQSWKCSNNHSFDIAKEGYVNLILANKKSSLQSGDGREMILARDAFLQLGLYDFLIDFILKLDLEGGRKVGFLEIGCGSAYYLDKIAKALSIEEVYGSDISKEAIKFCAKKYRNYHFSVDNSFDMNFRDSSFDLILSIFSPFKNSEIERIMAKKGRFIMVRQNVGHLKEIYKLVGMPEKEKAEVMFENLKLVKSFDLKKRIRVSDEQLQLLIAMSPLAWKIDQEAILPGAIKQITVSFKIAVYS